MERGPNIYPDENLLKDESADQMPDSKESQNGEIPKELDYTQSAQAGEEVQQLTEDADQAVIAAMKAEDKEKYQGVKDAVTSVLTAPKVVSTGAVALILALAAGCGGDPSKSKAEYDKAYEEGKKAATTKIESKQKKHEDEAKERDQIRMVFSEVSSGTDTAEHFTKAAEQANKANDAARARKHADKVKDTVVIVKEKVGELTRLVEAAPSYAAYKNNATKLLEKAEAYQEEAEEHAIKAEKKEKKLKEQMAEIDAAIKNIKETIKDTDKKINDLEAERDSVSNNAALLEMRAKLKKLDEKILAYQRYIDDPTRGYPYKGDLTGQELGDKEKINLAKKLLKEKQGERIPLAKFDNKSSLNEIKAYYKAQLAFHKNQKAALEKQQEILQKRKDQLEELIKKEAK